MNDDITIIREHAEKIARGEQRYIWGKPYFACCKALNEPSGRDGKSDGLFYGDDDHEYEAHPRLVTMAMAIAVLSEPHK